MGVINSLVRNSRQASRLRILALAPVGAEASFMSYLECHSLHPVLTVRAANDSAADTTATLRVGGFKGRIKARVAGGFNLAGAWALGDSQLLATHATGYRSSCASM